MAFCRVTNVAERAVDGFDLAGLDFGGNSDLGDEVSL